VSQKKLHRFIFAITSSNQAFDNFWQVRTPGYLEQNHIKIASRS